MCHFWSKTLQTNWFFHVQVDAMQQALNLPQLAGLFAKALQPLSSGPCIIAGVGLYTMVAFELSTQLQQLGRSVELLIAFESVPVSQARLALPALDETITGELMQVWCGLYQLIVEAKSSQQLVGQQPAQQQQQQQQLPELGAMMQHLYSLQSYEEQLEFVSTFCPTGTELQAWDSKVHDTLSRVLHLMQLLHSYQPSKTLLCPAMLVHGQDHQQLQQGPVRVTQLLSRVADDSWRQIAPALLPITACSMTAYAVSDSSHACINMDAASSEAGRSSGVSGHSSVKLQGPINSETRLDAAVMPLNSLNAENRYNASSG